jgi:hypothetical protein
MAGGRAGAPEAVMLGRPGPTQEQAQHDAAFYVVLNAGSGHAETELRCSTIRDVLQGSRAPLRTRGRGRSRRARRHRARMAARPAESAGSWSRPAATAPSTRSPTKPCARAACSACCRRGPSIISAAPTAFPKTWPRPCARCCARACAGADRHGQRPHLPGQRQRRPVSALLEEREQDKRQYGRSRVGGDLSALKTALGRHRNLRITLELEGRCANCARRPCSSGTTACRWSRSACSPLDACAGGGRAGAIAPRPVGKLRMLGLLLRGALGRLGEADDVTRLRLQAPDGARAAPVAAPHDQGRHRRRSRRAGTAAALPGAGTAAGAAGAGCWKPPAPHRSAGADAAAAC